MKQAGALLLLGLLGCDKPAQPGSWGDDPLAWSQANPIVSDATWRDAGILECRSEQLRVCTPQGCQEEPAKVFVRWTPSKALYQRCGGNEPCGDYEPVVTHSGSWTNLSMPANAMIARVTASGQFVEVATQMEAVLVYHGQCTRQALDAR